MIKTDDTAFAPARRMPEQELREQQEALGKDTALQTILNAMPDLVMVLNSTRQIVFGNAPLHALAISQGCNDFIGMRPGELLNCRHAQTASCGCGTSEACRDCGAVQTILAALDGRKGDAECRILCHGPSGLKALDLKVWGTPFRWYSENLALIVATDISDQKRRSVLERIFFHDILNTAGTINSMTELMFEGMLTFEEAKEDLRETARILVAEIKAQRELLAAENEELAVTALTVDSREILQLVAAQYRNDRSSAGKEVVVAPDAAQVTLVTDGSLLVRVLGNLVKNALEASDAGDRVAVSAAEREEAVAFTCWNRKPIEPGIRSQIFNRSFSTKGHGRGIGTYSVKLLTEKYLKGIVEFASSPTAGTTFTVVIPRTRD